MRCAVYVGQSSGNPSRDLCERIWPPGLGHVDNKSIVFEKLFTMARQLTGGILTLCLNNGSCIRLRPEYKDQVWSYDLVMARTAEGKAFRILTLIDEYTIKCPLPNCAIITDDGHRVAWFYKTSEKPHHEQVTL